METVGVDGKAFYRALPKAAESLTKWPQTLCMLVELYISKGCFGDVDKIYQQIIEPLAKLFKPIDLSLA